MGSTYMRHIDRIPQHRLNQPLSHAGLLAPAIATHERTAMEGNRAAGDPDPPRDLNIQRYQDDRTPAHTPYVNVNDFNNTIRMVSPEP